MFTVRRQFQALAIFLAWLVSNVDGDGGVARPGGLSPAGGLHVVGGGADVVAVVARVDALEAELGSVLVELVVALLVPLQDRGRQCLS